MIRCPECGSDNLTIVVNWAGIKGLTLHQCNDCGYDWKGEG